MYAKASMQNFELIWVAGIRIQPQGSREHQPIINGHGMQSIYYASSQQWLQEEGIRLVVVPACH